ncbi:nuclear GTPase SLIP-GC [Struthio camelus]|uniref:nuclear GTPase SLIP-GC n=1 Tax=Struthio camelus TaxID=8801 RepID=UPI003603C15D
MAEGGPEQGNNDSAIEETPRKKRKFINSQNVEDEALRNYKKKQKALRTILDQSCRKLSEFLSLHSVPGTTDGFGYIKNRLTGLKPNVLQDPIYVGLFGSTGAGKSTLLNAIIEKKFFLPVSGSKTCTSCVVHINTSRSKYHEAKIHLLDDEEWKDELKALVALMELEENSENDNERDEAALKIRAIYGRGAETKTYRELCGAKPVVSIPSSRCIVFKELQAEELSEKLDMYIRAQSISDDTESETSEEDIKMQLWPLIRNVEVTLPRSDVIPEGVIFLDIPGAGDFNSKRDAMWKENINKCSVIWVVSSFERIQGKKIDENLLNEGMKAFQCGMCRDIALVATKSDSLDLEEYKRERKKGQKPITNEHDAILERNETVKQEKSKVMKKQLEKKLPSHSEVLQKADLVYTVSAREYWQGRTLSKEETEIPKLREFLRNFYVSEKRKMLKDYAKETLVIFALIQNLSSNQDKQHLQVRKNGLKDFIMGKISELEKDIEKCFTPMEQHLSEGVNEAKRSYETIISTFLKRDHGYQGFHRTLKAVCLKNGVFASRIFDRIDINESLAQPIYDKIDATFGQIFRIQMSTRAMLKASLVVFRCAVQQRLKESETKKLVTFRFEFLEQETDFIINEIEKVILQRKADIYHSLSASIQKDLTPYYEEAAKIRGSQAYQRMQNVINQGLKNEVERGMFEKAKEDMKSELQKLKVEITRKLEKDFSDMLSLAFCPWDALDGKLPGLQQEFFFVNMIDEELQSAEDA